MNYKDKVFQMLGLRPMQEFKLNNSEMTYRICEDLTVQWADKNDSDEIFQKALINIKDILNGTRWIVSTGTLYSAEDIIIIKYALLGGYSWLAMDDDGELYAYKNKPDKTPHGWVDRGCDSWLFLPLTVTFVHPEDEEPYFIGDYHD